MDFANWLRRQIEDRLLTQEQFAAAADVSRYTVTTWLSGRSVPRGTSVVRIARALGIEREQVDQHLPASAAA